MKKPLAALVIILALCSTYSCEDKGDKSYPEIDEQYQSVPVELIKEDTK